MSVELCMEDVEKAMKRIRGAVHRTPVMECSFINSISEGLSFYFKCELFQKTGSFKVRGALNGVLIEKERLVQASSNDHPDVAMKLIGRSTGNYAQALSWAASCCGFTADIVMPDNTPPLKIEAVEGYGGRVHLAPLRREDQVEMVEKLKLDYSPLSHYIPTPDIIAGQGTIAMELLEQVPDLDAIIASVGGGGMISGISIAAKAIKPGIKIIAAEPEKADECARSVAAGHLLLNETWPDTVCDSLRMNISAVTLPYILKYASGVITVSDDEVIAAMRMVWERMKLVIETGAACAVAAALSPKFKQMAGPEVKKVGVILCGGNVDLEQLPWMPK